MSMREPRSGGVHTLSPADVVALTNASDAMRRYAQRANLADLQLAPGLTADGLCQVAWTVPGLPIPPDFAVGRNRDAHLVGVPSYLGELDAATHTWPVGDHRAGSGEFRPDPVVDDIPTAFKEYPTGAGTGAMAIGIVVPDVHLAVTESGVFHTMVPLQPIVVDIGYNLGVYLASLAGPDQQVPWQWCETTMASYCNAMVAAFAMRAAHECPCRRTIRDHLPRWATVHACAAAVTGRPGRLPTTRAPADQPIP
ncbi:hypothetical protein [Embleya sp. AB8]|uniref:hypothetical protein n=1 Tax=Embleya sp. AB8 TaxID=3156304 RepID=UPI003C78756A